MNQSTGNKDVASQYNLVIKLLLKSLPREDWTLYLLGAAQVGTTVTMKNLQRVSM